MKKVLLLTSLFVLALSSLCFAAMSPWPNVSEWRVHGDHTDYIAVDSVKMIGEKSCRFVIVEDLKTPVNNVAHYTINVSMNNGRIYPFNCQGYDADWNNLGQMTVDEMESLKTENYNDLLAVVRALSPAK